MPARFSIKPARSAGAPRLFFVIPKREFSKSAERNRIKRRFRAALRPVLERGKSSYTVFVKKGVLETPFSEIKEAARNQR